MKKNLSVILLLSLFPLLSHAQPAVHGLHFSFGYDVFNAPFLQGTVAMADHQRPVWRDRKALELSWDLSIQDHFLMRTRFALSFDDGAREIGRHTNYYVPDVTHFGGGNSLTLVQDFGYQRKFAGSRITLSAGAGLGATLLVGAGGWVGPLQSRDAGDPLDELYSVSYDAFGAVAQPFVGLSYAPIRQLSIGLEQRHEFSLQSVHLHSRQMLYNGEDMMVVDIDHIKTDYGRSLSYMPPVIRVGWTFDARKPRIKHLPKEGVIAPTGL